MIQAPRSTQFDDVYFSMQDGLAETRHVFLDGNGLPEFWSGREDFTICETGFGTGLNLLAVLKLWNDTPEDQRPKKLNFISFEKFPLSRDYIAEHLSCWPELEDELSVFLANYPSDLKLKRHQLVIDGVSLVLLFGDINDQMPNLDVLKGVDCWFLDGFKPSSNPDMWSETVFENMARLSAKKARFATFTAAGFVRRGLEAVGFEVQKVPGFGRKREMCVGEYKGGEPCG